MSPEERIRTSDLALVDVHVANVARIEAEADKSSKVELNTLVAGAAFASRRLSGALAASRKGVDDTAARAKAAKAIGMKASAANENDIDADPEMKMDDDTGRTPERVEHVRAEIQRRLGLARRAGEFKSLDGGGAVDAGGALLGDVKDAGSPPDPSD